MKKEEYIDIFTHNVKWLRIKHGLSVKQMSTILNTTMLTVEIMERGILPEEIKTDILFENCKHFNITINLLTEVKLTNYLFEIE